MRRTAKAFTLPELLALLAVIMLIVIFILPALLKMKARASRVHCVNNAKNIGLALRIYASDNNDLLPFEPSLDLSVTNGGGVGFRTNIIAQFQVLSNDLSTPLIIICPERNLRMTPATNFATLARTNLGYFLAITASQKNPDSILAGDTGLLVDRAAVSNCIVQIATNNTISYPPNLHTSAYRPSMLCSDGSVRPMNASNLPKSLRSTPNGTNIFLVP
jgi:type II secretory pathway pseudopilin PulG